MGSLKQTRWEMRDEIEDALYKLEDELDGAQMELTCWEIRVTTLMEDKASLKSKLEELV
jgi:hypothetical protein